MRLRSQPLENVGSCARDHLANERTYLAWIRTALAVVSIGIAFHEFVPSDQKPPIHVAIFLLILGVALMLYSLVSYYTRLRNLKIGKFGPDRAGPILLSVMLGLVALIGAWLLIS